MKAVNFYSVRFGTEIVGELRYGDEVYTDAGIRAIVMRNPYPIGMSHELFTTISYGHSLSSQPIAKLRKTGKNYAELLDELFYPSEQEKEE